jgi:hypothetical protein
MTSNTNFSQISLIKVKSDSPKCWVFFDGNGQLNKYEMAVDESTTVQNIIATTIDIIKNGTFAIDFNAQDCLFELYACKKSGRKVSDLPSFEEKQTILKTGINFFILKDLAKKAKTHRLSSASTKSILSEIKVAVPKQK